MSPLPDAHELAGYTLGAQHPLTRTWVADGTRLGLLARQHELDVMLAVDLDIAARRAARFAPGAAPTELLNRWVHVDGDLHAMMSIRYEGEEPNKPFIDATPLSRPLRAADIPALCRAAQRCFGQLRPSYLRLWSAQSEGRFPGCLPDKRFVAGRLDILRRGGDHPDPAGLDVRPARTLENYARAQRAYDAVRAVHPEHRGQAALQSEADLGETAEAGLLFDVTVDGAWAGYVAATTSSETLGLPAYVVQELVLAPEFRGRKYGAHLTTLLARAVPDDESILIGTIHAGNRGALRAALAAGRVDVGGWVRAPL